MIFFVHNADISPSAPYTHSRQIIIINESNQQRTETIMKLIKPSEISSSILTLLDESDERVIIVSLYMKVSKWLNL